MEDKKTKKFNRLVIKLFLLIGLIPALLAIIVELSGYVFMPYGEGKYYPVYRQCNVLSRTIGALNTVGYWVMGKVGYLLGISTYGTTSYFVFFAFQVLFYFLLGWLLATLLFPFRTHEMPEPDECTSNKHGGE